MSHQDKNNRNRPPRATSHDIDMVYLGAVSLLDFDSKRTVLEPVESGKEGAGVLKQSVRVPYLGGELNIYRFREPSAADPTKADESAADPEVRTDTPIAIEIYDKAGKLKHDFYVRDSDRLGAGSLRPGAAEAYDLEAQSPLPADDQMTRVMAKTLLAHMAHEIPAQLAAGHN